MLRNFLLIYVLLATLLSCHNDKPPDFSSYVVDSDYGIDPRKHDLTEDDPPGVQIEYFPRNAIRAARVKICKLFEIDTVTERLSREVQFNFSGDIIKDSNYYFQDYNLGSKVGTSIWLYDSLGRVILIKAGSFGRGRDSSATVLHYTKSGLLFEKDYYVYKHHLKKGVDPHLTFPEDHEARASWRLDHTTRYLTFGDTVIIEKRDRLKIFEIEKYLLTFDKLNRLVKTTIIREGYLFDTTVYRYETNSVTAELARRGKDDAQTFVHSMRSVLNESGQVLRRQTVSDGSVDTEIIIAYNSNGTIKTISQGKYLKRFEYSFY